MELIIEQTSRSGKLLQRHKVAGDTISIGRSLANDVVLADPYVCAHHLSVSCDESGQWLISDQDTVNGSFDGSQQRLEQGRVIASGDVISIGKTRLRFIYPDHPVAPTIRLSGIEGFIDRISSPLTMLTTIAIYMFFLVTGLYLQSFSEIKTSQLFSTIMIKLFGVSLLPLIFAFLARMFKHDARLLTQMVVCFSFAILFMLLSFVNAFLSFNSDLQWFNQGFDFITKLGLTFCFFWLCCYIAFHQSTLRRTVIAGSITLGIFLFGYLYTASSDKDFNPKPSYDSTLLAPEFAFSTAIPIKEFINDSESVFELSAELVEEE